METSEFIRPPQKADALALTPVSSGATCETFKYQQWNKWFLLKRLRPELCSDPAAIAAFEKEFDLGIHLEHPGIVRYFEKGIDAEGIYLVEEYIDGETLDTFSAQHSPLPVSEVRRIFSELADAVAYLHAQGIVHADLKADNVLITQQGHHPKLIDLGFSGQYSYASLSEKDKDTRSDVLALGKMLDILAPGRFRRIVRKATAEQPSRRYPTPEAMAAAVNRKPGRWIAAAAAVLLLLAGVSLPFLRHPTMTVVHTASASVGPADSTQTAVTEAFRATFRQEVDRIFGPFNASFDAVNEENFGRLLHQYQSHFDELTDTMERLIREWSEQYPELSTDFETIAAHETNGAVNHFNRETQRWQNEVRASYFSTTEEP